MTDIEKEQLATFIQSKVRMLCAEINPEKKRIESALFTLGEVTRNIGPDFESRLIFRMSDLAGNDMFEYFMWNPAKPEEGEK